MPGVDRVLNCLAHLSRIKTSATQLDVLPSFDFEMAVPQSCLDINTATPQPVDPVEALRPIHEQQGSLASL
jgi:hypothetical protein